LNAARHAIAKLLGAYYLNTSSAARR